MIKILKKLRAYVRYRRALILADRAFSKTGERQYVMCYGDKLVVIDRKTLKYNKMKKVIDRSRNVKDLELGAVYYTSYKNGTGSMSETEKIIRKQRYYRYVL